MRVVIQRVSKASVEVENNITAKIDTGILVLLGVEHADSEEDASWLCKKIANLRIFDDENGVMNRSLIEVDGEVIVVSQFTLHAATKKGNRPSYIKAAKPETAIPLYEYFVRNLETEINKPVQTGKFGAMMDVHLTNSGPVTILIDSKNKE
ncbi:D-tyrosyl-tRNA(Tyr) deacylase [Paucihalobacter ruber]|uniref:D-aminoacyl-tRNA deacylase n=1 Tax=Paucihalobacter ruber TaxID=2567861 RepID=A0A506PEG0_9FLAO|nr:D-aminoacyl-tRNA deacylase [Paucihalobacter ruber]TPV31969.1 D-tyrosyl-tRNA(Tyr) deacylase [Paucihalobacter ruber]